MKARAILKRYPVVLLVLLALLAAVWVANRPARAQTTTQEVVFVDNLGVTPDSNGYVTLDFRDPSVTEVWLLCGGSYPLGGTSQIPSQVLTRKPDPRIVRLRVFNPTGHPVTAWVRVTCTFDIVGPAPTSPTSLRERVAKVVQQAG